ncbi:MlaD family protein [Paraconexibacter antarcticus]|uniref:MlaD family protein n=1 Tax=Paraconexibacter antarcticus TaxID=2949664 RepID=A0ABY5DVM8_9ACTN|nr:MlaD family protein [Paraconexibacter antarcticus]UTI65122.1 MlaD family protein [Paraconexibacter antarcticus]
MRRRRDRISNLGAGLLVIGVTLIAVFFAFTKANPFANPYKLHAIFSSALSNGVRPNAPVRIAGVAVGKVTDVGRGPGTTVRVTMEIDKRGLPIHADATIKARPRLFLEGNYFLELRPGTPSAPAIPDGGTVPLGRTAIPVQFDQVLDVYRTDVRTSLQHLLGGLSTALAEGGDRALRANLRRAPAAFREGAVALEAARGTQDGDLAGVIREQARLNSTLDAHRVELQGLLGGFRGTMEALASQQGPLAATVPALRGLLDRTPAAVAALDRTLPALRTIAVALRPGLRAAPPVLDHAVPFLHALGGLTAPARLPALVTQLRAAAPAISRVEATLPPLLDVVRPVSQCVTTRVVPVLDATVPDGPLTAKGRTVWQELFSLGTGLLSSQQNFGGDGYSTRYSFGLGAEGFATKLPGPGNLIQLGSDQTLGSRPAFHNDQPAFAPDAPCLTQPLTSLQADTAPPAGRSARVSMRLTAPLTPARVRAATVRANRPHRASRRGTP